MLKMCFTLVQQTTVSTDNYTELNLKVVKQHS